MSRTGPAARAGWRHRAAKAAYRTFGHLPRPVRRRLIRLTAPTFTVGALCAVVDGADVLLVRLSYRRHWGLPGGMCDRGELPAEAAVREVGEEVGVAVDLTGEPVWIMLPRLRRIDVAFRCRLADGVDRSEARACSPEIVEVRWCPLVELPRMHGASARVLRHLGLAGEAGQGRSGISPSPRRRPSAAPSARTGGAASSTPSPRSGGPAPE